jgi:hypothetical protein
MKLFIDPALDGKRLYEYVFRLIAFNKGFEIELVSSNHISDIILSNDARSDFNINPHFYKNLRSGLFSHEYYFGDRCVILDNSGREDYLSSIFYCTNSIQEYYAKSKDSFGRFQFNDSYQKKFNNIKTNLVQQFIDALCNSNTKLNKLTFNPKRSRIFLSHDIDTIYGSWKEDGFAALKKGRIDLLAGLALRAISNKHDWINFDTIMDIENEYGYRSVFYWLLYKDKMNADYDSESKIIKDSIRKVKNRGWENGLHKSLHTHSMNDEAKRLEAFSGGNRFHYLNFKLPDGYNDLHYSDVTLDSSLGFSEKSGFRNSYGLPFVPFNIKEENIYNFLEVPLHVMDRTFYKEGMDVAQIYKNLIEWFESNKTNCIFTLNFHNNFFTSVKYDGYRWLYKELLKYFVENKFEGITQKELIADYYRPELFQPVS